jgi:hypothetical protein
MSRTYKDSNRVKLKRYYKERWETEHTKFVYEGEKYVWPDFNTAVGVVMRVKYLKKPGVLTKKRKEVDTTDHWMSTPGWWVKMTMNRPERRGSHLQEKQALKEIDIEDVDFPDLGRKPHCYYW